MVCEVEGASTEDRLAAYEVDKYEERICFIGIFGKEEYVRRKVFHVD